MQCGSQPVGSQPVGRHLGEQRRLGGHALLPATTSLGGSVASNYLREYVGQLGPRIDGGVVGAVLLEERK